MPKLRKSIAGVATALALVAGNAAADCPSPTAEQFGYASLPAHPANIPLLITLVDFGDAEVNPARGAAYYRGMVFGLSRSVNRMYQSASGGRLSFRNAGVVSISVPYSGDAIPAAAAYDAQVTRLTAVAMLRAGGRTLQSFDRNRDGRIDNSELLWLRVSNSPRFRRAGQTRLHSASFLGGTFAGRTANVDEEVDINGVAHEILHSLGNNDHIYGPGTTLNMRRSFFARSFGAPGPGPIALDPYNRMRMGWLSPKLVPITSAGTLGLRHYGDSGDDDTLLFYDPVRCAAEFFLVEFRNRNAPTGALVDFGSNQTGVNVWYVKPSADFSPYQFNWPPPIEGPFVPGAADHMVANYVVGFDVPGGAPPLTPRNDEFQPVWGDGSPAGFGLEAAFAESDDVAFVGWRRLPGRFVATVEGINGTDNPVIAIGATFALTGRFPVRAADVTATLFNFSAGTRAAEIVGYAPERIVLRAPPGTPPGSYRVQLVGGSPTREILTRGALIVTLR